MLKVSNKLGQAIVDGEVKTYKRYYTHLDYAPWLFSQNPKMQHVLKELPPCTFGEPIIEYLNKQQVRKALHIPQSAKAWDMCHENNITANWTYTKNTSASQWVYEMYKDKYRMLHYSGDTDGAVPTLGTFRWVSALNWTITTNWTTFTVNRNLAGYYEDRGQFTLMSIHGAGHMAPQAKRAETYTGVFNWLF